MFTCERGYFLPHFLWIHIAFRMIRILFTWHFVSLAATKGKAHFRVSAKNCVRFLMCHCVGIRKIWIAKKSQNLNSCRIYVARKNSTTKHFMHYCRCGKRSVRCLFVKSNWMKNEASGWQQTREGEKSERSLNHNHNSIVENPLRKPRKYIIIAFPPPHRIQCKWIYETKIFIPSSSTEKWQQPQRLWLYRWHNNNANRAHIYHVHINTIKSTVIMMTAAREEKNCQPKCMMYAHDNCLFIHFSSRFLIWSSRQHFVAAMKTNKKISKLKKHKHTHTAVKNGVQHGKYKSKMQKR